MHQLRRADARWNGNLTEGRGVVSAATSEAFSELPITWASRTESPDGRTSPEELVAAAHAACYSMAFSSELFKNGTPADEVQVTAQVRFDKLERWTVTRSDLTVRGWVPGIDADRFREIAELAKETCPISRMLKGTVELSVDATLEG
jgi:osmotically inducible protein OsmC